MDKYKIPTVEIYENSDLERIKYHTQAELNSIGISGEFTFVT